MHVNVLHILSLQQARLRPIMAEVGTKRSRDAAELQTTEESPEIGDYALSNTFLVLLALPVILDQDLVTSQIATG